MKWIKIIAAYSLLIFIFLIASAQESTSRQLLQEPAHNAIEKIDFLKAAAFVQPHTTPALSLSNRDHFPLTAKWFVTYTDIKFCYAAPIKVYTAYFRQDINRCLKVSILLFPFNIFW